MESANTVAGILDEDARDARGRIIVMLTRAYWMEIETVISYLAASINPDGVRAQEVIRSLEQDVSEELGHARQFGARIKELYGVVPGSPEFAPEQDSCSRPRINATSSRSSAASGRSSTTTRSSRRPRESIPSPTT